MLQLDKRTDRILPNGWCLLPPRQHCSKGNACLTCDKFATDATFLPELTTQLTRTEQLIGERCEAFRARTGQEISEDNVWLAGRRQEQDALGQIIVKLEQTRLADGSIQALRGAGASARTDAIAQPSGEKDSTMRGNPGNLRRAAAAKSAAAQARAENGLEQMLRRGDPITFRGLAQTAGVSLDFLYPTPGIRSRVEQLRARQQATPAAPAPRTRTGPAEQRDPDAHHPAHRAQAPSPRRNQHARQALETAHGENLQLRRRLGHQDTTAPLP